MIKSAQFPNKTFETKRELFLELKSKNDEIINLKSIRYKNSESVSLVDLSKFDTAKGLILDDKFSYHVINTTKYLDNHDDVHDDGIWAESVKEQQGKIYFVADHNLLLDSVIAYPKDVDMSVQTLLWKDLGLDYEGETEALIFKINKSVIRHKEALNVIENDLDIEHSVRMKYLNIELAIDDSSKDFVDEKAVFDSMIGKIANKAKAIEQGYFYKVSKADVAMEGSMVLFGSNGATPILRTKKKKTKKTVENKVFPFCM